MDQSNTCIAVHIVSQDIEFCRSDGVAAERPKGPMRWECRPIHDFADDRPRHTVLRRNHELRLATHRVPQESAVHRDDGLLIRVSDAPYTGMYRSMWLA